jgi:hypothetical protein
MDQQEKPSRKYTISEISRQYGDSMRQVQRKLKELVNVDGKAYIIDSLVVDLMYSDSDRDNNRDNRDSDVAIEDIEVEYDVVEGFSAAEYQEFQKRLIEYPLLKDQIAALEEQIDYHKNQVEYHKSSTESTRIQMESLLEGFRERNFIEAKDKGFDKTFERS